jgi:hypothetical protein
VDCLVHSGVAEITSEHWRKVYGRIWREIRQDVRLDSPVRVLRELLVPILTGVIAALTTHSVAWTALASLVALIVLAIGAFAWKLVTVPPRMLAEHETEIAALQALQDSAGKRRATREALGDLLSEGHALIARCSDETTPAPQDEANDWSARVEAVFRGRLDESYVARFHDESGLPLTATSIYSAPHRNLWSAISSRNARLQEFIREVV